jgi:DNA-binding transcriptional regulator YhcF (GntR family)
VIYETHLAEPHLTRRQLADRFGVSPGLVQKAINDGIERSRFEEETAPVDKVKESEKQMSATSAPTVVERITALEQRYEQVISFCREYARQLGITHDDAGVQAAVDDFLASCDNDREKSE